MIQLRFYFCLFLAVDNFYFDEKKWLKKFSERTRENVGVLQFLAVETSISRYIQFFFDFLREKVREIVTVLHFLVVDNFNLKKIVEKLMAKNY